MSEYQSNFNSIFKYNTYSSAFELGLIVKSNQILKGNLDGDTILELGCGIGFTTSFLIDDSEKYTCVELSEKYIDSTKKRIENNSKATFHNSSWELFESTDNYSDIICLRGLDCVDDLDVIFKKLKELSSDKTSIHIVVTNTNSFHRIVADKLQIDKVNTITNHAINVGRKQPLNYEVMMDYFKKHDFEVVDFEGIGFKMFSNEEMDNFSEERIEAFLGLGNVSPKLAVELYFKLRCK